MHGGWDAHHTANVYFPTIVAAGHKTVEPRLAPFSVAVRPEVGDILPGSHHVARTSDLWRVIVFIQKLHTTASAVNRYPRPSRRRQ